MRSGCILEMPPSEVPGRAVSEDAAASWSAAGLCRFAIYAQKTVLTLLAPKPKRQRAGALQKLRHVVAPPRGRCADAPFEVCIRAYLAAGADRHTACSIRAWEPR